ncbi:MAG: ATP-binding cassette domain-containing protein [Lachnospiraceae bacterium]|jgi:ABC-2 type transport system ATP-binding protein|nr:ATP-binding cassette domain-containing protein [Lachnospiraceae bacterium]
MKLEVREIRKSFGDKEVLHGISFEVESGRALGLLGRNGAGKTTTIRVLMDVFRPSGGQVLADGKSFVPKEHKIGYLPEERGLYPQKKVLDQMVYLAKLRGMGTKEARESGKWWLKRLEIDEYADRKLETLSKGNQQKVQLAQTLICNPDMIILDEPFSGLDPVNSQILKDVVQEQIALGKLVIFSSHQMGYVEEFCEDIAIINHGDIVLGGSLKEIKQEMGKNRLTLSAVNYSIENLAEKVKAELSHLVQVEQVKKEYLILEGQCKDAKKKLLAALSETDIDVEQTGMYEPSLNDIFVAKAGDGE